MGGDPEVGGVAYDSRKVRPGDVFVSIRGRVTDGHLFIPEALRRGARAVVVENPSFVPPGIPYAVSPDTRRELSRLAARFYGHPSRELCLWGVTGTNGKTTTAYLLAHLLEERGRVGLIGTVVTRLGGKEWLSERTTPESADIQGYFRDMVSSGCWAAVMEVSSHSLVLHRVEDCHFDGAIFTGLSPEHLDFHGTMEDYFRAKMRLFELLRGSAKPRRVAAVNGDHSWGRRVLSELGNLPSLAYGFSPGLPVRGEVVESGWTGSRFLLHHPRGKEEVWLPLPGRFNVENALGAFSAGLLLELDPAAMAARVGSVPPVPGRFEVIEGGQDFRVVVDYAHTPEGLEFLLREIRRLTRGKVWVVFGCGGDRDRQKRPRMGEVAARWADGVIITSDNPRSEEPEAIAREVAAGVRRAGREPRIILDRREAIREALRQAGPGDAVAVAGKGHEREQVFRDRVERHDDREEVRVALRELGYDPLPVG